MSRNLLPKLTVEVKVISFTAIFQFILYASTLKINSLHIDESRQLLDYRGGFVSMAKLSYAQQQPPLDALIGFLWTHIFGLSIYTSRFPSVLFSVGIVILFQKIISKYLGWYIALFVGLSFVVFPWFIEYSRYARPYAIVTFLFLLGLHSLQNHKHQSISLFLFALILLPWARAIEGNIGFIILLTAGFYLKIAVSKKQKYLLFLTILIGFVSILFNFITLRNISPQYAVPINIYQIRNAPINAFIFILKQFSELVNVSESLFLIAAIITFFTLLKFGNPELLKLNFFMFLFGYLSICTVLAFSNIEPITRYTYFLIPALFCFLANLFALLPKLCPNKLELYIAVFLSPLLLFSGVKNVNFVSFPQFHSVNKLVQGLKQENVYAFMFSDINQYLEPWPFDPSYSKVIKWLPAYVRSGGELPKTIVLMPPVDAGYNINFSQMKLTGLKEKDFPKYIDLGSNPVVELVKLYKMTKFESRYWFLLAAIRMNSLDSNPASDNIFQEICSVRSVVLNSGPIFGEWEKQGVTIDTILSELEYTKCN